MAAEEAEAGEGAGEGEAPADWETGVPPLTVLLGLVRLGPE